MDNNNTKPIENQRLEAFNAYLGWTKKRFAESIGLSASNYSKIINNGMDIPSRAMYMLQTVHKVDLDWVYGNIDSVEPIFLKKEVKAQDDRLRELEQKLMKAQEELLAYKTRENENLKNDKTLLVGQ